MIPHAYITITHQDLNNEGVPPSTEVVRYDQFVQELFKPGTHTEMLMHAALGICGEAGEIGNAVKKQVV